MYTPTFEPYELYEDLFRDSPGMITFAAMRGFGRDGVRRFRHVDKSGIKQAVIDLLKINEDRLTHATVGIATRKPGLNRYSMGTLGELEALPAVYADVDHQNNVQRLMDAMLIPPPSAVINSGRGKHFYWFIEPSNDFVTAHRVMTFLAMKLGGCMFNVTQPLRMIGSINPKYGNHCSLVRWDSNTRYKLENLAALIPPRKRNTIPETADKEDLDIRLKIKKILLEQYEGTPRRHHGIDALCPCGGHKCDSPGAHFCYDYNTGHGQCFGKHGHITPTELRELLKIS